MIDAETKRDFDRLKELLSGIEGEGSLSESEREEVGVLRKRLQAYIRRSEIFDPHIGIIEKPFAKERFQGLTNELRGRWIETNGTFDWIYI